MRDKNTARWIAKKRGTRRNFIFRVLWRHTCIAANAPNGPKKASTSRAFSLVRCAFRTDFHLSQANTPAAIRFRQT